MKIRAINEYNQNGHMIYADNYVGAFVRGRTQAEAMGKFEAEIVQYNRWLGIDADINTFDIEIIQEKYSDLAVCDADTDILFISEIPVLTKSEYDELKRITLKSAYDFLVLYNSIINKNETTIEPRKTFYGDIPRSANEMYNHTKNVNSYYFGEINVEALNGPDIYSCRINAFETLEKQSNFLDNQIFEGSYGEQWSLRKVCRRFIWHDRIHAKAMYRMAGRLQEVESVKNTFCFEL
ncbi:MAG: hypothetical protein ACRDDX_10340 [Cellulosilyticaceae bacterium]